jgi:hypothetical protein
MHEIERIDRGETDDETWDDNWQRAKFQPARNISNAIVASSAPLANRKLSDMKRVVDVRQSASAPPSVDAAAAEPPSAQRYGNSIALVRESVARGTCGLLSDVPEHERAAHGSGK